MQKPPKDPRDISVLFDALAAGYNDPALRFFPFAADRLVVHLAPSPGDKILDVATGTGHVAIAAAQAVGSSGRVIGIDLAEGMLARAQQHIAKCALTNVDLHRMDASHLEFRAQYFNHIACAFALFFLPDIPAALKDWVRVTRRGGRIAFSAFGPAAFHPLIDQFCEDLRAFGVDCGELAIDRLRDAEVCRRYLADAGLHAIEVFTEQVGYHLRNPEEWWSVVWNSGPRGLISRLEPTVQEDFKSHHLERIAKLASENGIWLDVETHFVMGRIS